MSIKDAVDLLFASRERIDFYWNFYVVVVVAVIGWIVTRKEPLTTSTRILVSVAYIIAAVTNLLGLYASYTVSEALRTDVLRMTAGSPLTDTRIILAQHSYLSQRIGALLVHGAVGAAILLVLWRGNPGRAGEPTSRA